MRRPRLESMVPRAISLAALALGAAACGQLPASGVTSQSPIFGGTADSTHDAVMALINQVSTTNTSACSGTTIATVGASGIFLTAGHCVVANDGNGHVTTPLKLAAPADIYIVPGPDWGTSVGKGLYYGVAQVSVHPMYDGAVDSPFDVALVRYEGALPSTPTIPALGPTDDKLAVGSAITVVGFGKTETETAQMPNSQRREVDRTIQSLTANQFVYNQTDLKGACQGDSGGPSLVTTPAGLRVAGVTSFGDPNCTMVGASVRVSPVFTSYIQAFINAAPKTSSCDDCALASVGPGNACVNQSVACAASNSACGKFLGCADACTSSACVTQCQRSNPSGATAYNAIVTCQCGGACAKPCVNNTICGGSAGSSGAGGAPLTGAAGAGGSSGAFTCADFVDSRPSCETCMQTTCCTQELACANDPTCAACLVDPTGAGCRTDVAYSATTQCLASCPGEPCSAASAADGGAQTGAAGTAGQTGGKAGCGCDVGSTPLGGFGLGALLALAAAMWRARVPARVRVSSTSRRVSA